MRIRCELAVTCVAVSRCPSVSSDRIFITRRRCNIVPATRPEPCPTSTAVRPDERRKYLLYEYVGLRTTIDDWDHLLRCSASAASTTACNSYSLTIITMNSSPLLSPGSSSRLYSLDQSAGMAGVTVCVPRFRLLCDDVARRRSGLSTIKLMRRTLCRRCVHAALKRPSVLALCSDPISLRHEVSVRECWKCKTWTWKLMESVRNWITTETVFEILLLMHQ